MNEDLRISKLRDFMFGIIYEITKDSSGQINANMLSNKKGDYSLDKIPTNTTIETWITGCEIHRDVYSFRSRKSYSQDTLLNLSNIGFFETFENIIKRKNEAGELPDIENIESIECLNCGSMVDNETNTAEFDIQIQITYRDNNDNGGIVSL